MRRILVLLAVAALAALPARAQMEPNTVGRIYQLKVKPGSEQAFEAGAKKHMEWHKSKNDSWTWLVWSVDTGEDTGQYIWGTFGHNWGDFDAPPVPSEEDAKDYYANMAPHVAGFEARMITALPNLGLPRAPDAPPAKLLSLYTIRIKTGTTEEFLNALARTKTAIEKTKWGENYSVSMQVAGGETGTYYIVVYHDSWAALGGTGKSFEQMLVEGLGHMEARAVVESFDRVIKSETSNILRFRPELSYIPAAK